MPHDHVVVWMDHHEAHVQSFTRDESDSTFVEARGKHCQVHHRKGSIDGAKASEDQEFFSRVGQFVENAHEILVVGPAQAKTEFVKYLQHHRPLLAKRIVGVETADHPTEGQLLDYARRFFRAADRMLP